MIALLRVIVLILLLLFMAAPCQAAIFYDWYKMQTENFIIYYPREIEDIAQQVGAIAEDVHNELTAYLDHEPKGRTGLILLDDQDMPGGWAQAFWERKMAIYTAHPGLEMGLMGSYESWLRLVITHEYAHILQLTLPPAKLFPLGWAWYIMTPSLFQSMWFIEGFATYMETAFTADGRGESPVIRAILGAGADANTLYSFDQVQGPYNLESWPGGGRAIYYYGSSFLHYLEEQYGEDIVARLAQSYPENVFIGIKGHFRQLTGHNLEDIYRDWQKTLGGDEAKRLMEGELITSLYGYNVGASLSPDGRQVAYFHQGEGFSTLRLWDGRSDRELKDAIGIYGGRVSWSPRGNYLAYARLEVENHKGYNHGIYIYNLRTGQESRLTTGSNPAWSSRGEIACIQKVSGGNQVVLFSDLEAEGEVIIDHYRDRAFKGLEWNPTGSHLAVEVWLEGGNQGIWIWERDRNSLTPLFIEDSCIVNPSWSGDGRYIFFAAAPDDVLNIYAYQLEEERFWQVTNLPRGTYALSNRGDVALYTVMTEDGFQLLYGKLDRGNWREVELEKFDPVPVEDRPLDLDLEGRKYRLLLEMRPRFFMPHLLGSGGNLGVGFSVLGWDPLDLTYYEAAFFSDFQSAPEYFLYNQVHPDTGPFLGIETLLEGGQSALTGNRNDGGQFLFHLPLERDVFNYSILLLGGGLYWEGELLPVLHGGYSFRSMESLEYMTLDRNISLALSARQLPNAWGGTFTANAGYNYNLPEGIDIKTSLGVSLAAGPFSAQASVRGYPRPQTRGDFVLAGSVQPSYSLWEIKRGTGEFPLFLDSINISPYMDLGIIYDGGLEGVGSLGLEGILEMDLLYGRIPMNLIAGLNYNREGDVDFYLTMDARNPFTSIVGSDLESIMDFSGTFLLLEQLQNRSPGQ